MAKSDTEHRRLAAIMFIDMVGYTALTRRNEALALELLQEFRSLVRGTVSRHQGHEVKSLGDGFLVQFPSALAGMHCALEIQRALWRRKESTAADRYYVVRVGLHVGDVVIRENDVFGDGVNVASRVEALAQPGGICLTQQVYDQIQNRVDAPMLPKGLVALKNIAAPVPLYEILPPGGVQTPPEPTAADTQRIRRRSFIKVAGLAVAAVVVMVFVSPFKEWLPQARIRPKKHVVVVPFQAIGLNVDESAFSEGLVELIASKLTRFEKYHSAMRIVPTSEVRRENIRSPKEARQSFGATHVFTGSVSKDRGRLQVIVNLIDTSSASQVTQVRSDSFNEEPNQLHVLRDRISRTAAEWLGITAPAETTIADAAGETQNPLASDYYIRGLGALSRVELSESIEMASVNFKQALSLDPKFGLAHAGLAEVYLRKFEATRNPEFAGEAEASCKRALDIDARLVPALVVFGNIQLKRTRYAEAAARFEQALAIEPFNADALRLLGKTYEAQGLSRKAEDTFQRAIDRSPEYWQGYNDFGGFYYRRTKYAKAREYFEKVLSLIPSSHLPYRNLGATYFMLDDYSKAIEMSRRSIELHPTQEAYSNLGTVYFFQGNYGEAARMYELAIQPASSKQVIWGNLADAYRFTGRLPESTNAYVKALDLADNDLKVAPLLAETRASLAIYSARLGDKARARREIEQALANAAGNVYVHVQAALVYEAVGLRDQAIEQLRSALKDGYARDDIMRNPDFKDLRQDPQFDQLLSNNKP